MALDSRIGTDFARQGRNVLSRDLSGLAHTGDMPMSNSVVALKTRSAKAPDAETLSQTMQRLRVEAQVHARDHSLMFEQAVADLELLAADIAQGGEAYLIGVRETARRLGPELTGARLNLDSILGRKAQ